MFQAHTAFVKLRLTHPLELGGSSHLPRLFTSVRDEIEINLVVLSEGKTILAFLAIDALFAGDEITTAAKSAASHFFGPKAQLIVAASHTHNAPMLDRSKALLGRTADAFVNQVKHAIQSLFEEASKSAQRLVHITKAITFGTHGVNRRLTVEKRLARHVFLKRKKTFMAPNKGGGVDNSIRCLLLHGVGGNVVAALVQVACHPTSYPDRLTVTADYVAKLRAVLRSAYGSQLPVIFFQGFSGDVRPNCSGRLTVRAAANHIISGPGFQKLNPSQWDAWSDNISANLSLALNQQNRLQSLTGKLSVHSTYLPFNELLSNYAGYSKLETVHFNIGNIISGVAVNAEMLTGWLDMTQEHFFTVSCINDTFCYLPDLASVDNMGYEVKGFMVPFGIVASGWKPGYQNRVRSTLCLERRFKD